MNRRIAAFVLIMLAVYVGLMLLPDAPWVIPLWRYTVIIFVK